jgi:CDP-6-deoxy-D-xylo-4-hexulose-3-dehydrase
MHQDNNTTQIKELVKRHFLSQTREPFVEGQSKIPLAIASYGWEEVCEAMDTLLGGWVTMGTKVQEFEALFAKYIGVRHAIMVNSGSSANLVALSVLTNPVTVGRIQPGDEIITPAITWATTVFPIVNCGAVPVLVDVDLETFNIDVKEIEKAITPRTKAIMVVHLLGNTCDMQGIRKLALERGLFVIEDTCEAHGAEIYGRKVGSFGDISTFSFFMSHHISTIEGGMVLTDNDEYADLARAMRVFGWIRDRRDKSALAAQYEEIDPRFLFTNMGFNFRPTEIQGGMGIHQMARLEGFIDIRRENAAYWGDRLQGHSQYLLVHKERPGTRHVWFGYPLTVLPQAPFNRSEMMKFLEEKGVETRPIMAGNMDEQPAMRLVDYRREGELPVARQIMRNSFFFGNHQGIGHTEREAIASYIDEFIGTR